MQRSRSLVLLLGFLVSACSDGGSAAGPAIGTWQVYDQATGQPSGEMIFDGDGTITFVDGETGEEATAEWEVDGDQLTMRWQGDDGSTAKTTTYHADQDVMFLFTLLPDSGVGGVVGNWSAYEHLVIGGVPPVELTQTLTFDADGTVSFDQVGLQGDGELTHGWDGTWVEGDGMLEIETVDPETGGVGHPRYFWIPGVVISDEIPMTRIE